MTCVTPGWSRTSRSNRSRALGPNPAFGFGGPELSEPANPNAPSFPARTRFPEMPTLSTAGAALPRVSTSLDARTSGHRLFVSAVEAYPSVIESPNVTTTGVAAGAMTSTRDRKTHDWSVVSTGSVSEPVWLPCGDR